MTTGKRNPLAATLVCVAALLAGPANAADWRFQSPAEPASLIELFTSQGCNSCPPADRWLSQLQDDDGLFKTFVPVAFHVTYWDRLGWSDPFGMKSHDSRQRTLAANTGAVVYTPGMFVDGREWRGWRYGRGLPAASGGGVLEVTGEGNRIEVRFAPRQAAKERLRVQLTYLRSDRETAVRRGENRGRKLHNDFVAGRLVEKPLQLDGDRWQATFRAAAPQDARYVVAWVLDGNTVVQASGTSL